MMVIDDIYGRGMVRQWTLVGGFPVCIADGLISTDPAAIAAVQRNASVRAMVGAVEAYEAALRVIKPSDDIPRMIESQDLSGATISSENPIWSAWDAAQVVIAAATDTTKAHALWRSGEPKDRESPDWTTWDNARTVTLAALEAGAALPLAFDPRPVPESVPLWAARTVLRAMNLLDSANDAVAASGVCPLKDVWEYGNFISRSSPGLAMLAQALTLTAAQVDEAFRQAGALNA